MSINQRRLRQKTCRDPLILLKPTLRHPRPLRSYPHPKQKANALKFSRECAQVPLLIPPFRVLIHKSIHFSQNIVAFLAVDN